MKPAEPFLASSRPASSVDSESLGAAAGGRADSLVVRFAAATVLFASVATIVWYCVDAVLAL